MALFVVFEVSLDGVLSLVFEVGATVALSVLVVSLGVADDSVTVVVSFSVVEFVESTGALSAVELELEGVSVVAVAVLFEVASSAIAIAAKESARITRVEIFISICTINMLFNILRH